MATTENSASKETPSSGATDATPATTTTNAAATSSTPAASAAPTSAPVLSAALFCDDWTINAKVESANKDVVTLDVYTAENQRFSASVSKDDEPSEKEFKGFEVINKPIRHKVTNEIIDHEKVVRFKNQTMVPYLKSYLQSEDLHGNPPQATADELFRCRENLRNLIMPAFDELLAWLDSQYKELAEKIDNMLKENTISYKSLWYLFTKGKKVAGQIDTGHWTGAEISSAEYSTGMFQSFRINASVIKANGKSFYTTSTSFVILPYPGVKKINELNVRILDDKEDVTEKPEDAVSTSSSTASKSSETDRRSSFRYLYLRGKKFAQIGTGVHYLNYRGYVAQREGWWGYQLYKADGRAILDGVSFNRINPNDRGSSIYGSNDRYNETSNSFEAIPPDKYYMSWPTLLGFSFSAKQWGEFAVDSLSPVTFDETAFTRLVLPSEKKILIKSLVTHVDTTFADIISGKGGGCIFLIHGAPGVGKTLTAEAIAELMHRPLYSVSVGELGTKTTDLENKLREILEVSASWNAVILLDEADIFLEKRSESDIQRNAMVGIFLRLLEYHQGVLFLTTNRVKCFDRAFHSRISIALKYDDLDQSARQSVWENLLEAAGIPADIKKTLDTKRLSEYILNGRQIRTLVRLASSLARSEKIPISMDHLEKTIRICTQFDLDVST